MCEKRWLLTGIVLCSDVIGQIVIQDETKQAVEKGEINFLVNF